MSQTHPRLVRVKLRGEAVSEPPPIRPSLRSGTLSRKGRGKTDQGSHAIFLTGRPDVGLTSSPACANPLRA